MNPLAADLDHVLAHTEGLWEELRGGRLFLTGGTGWFGSWLLESFAWANDRLKLGAECVAMTRNPYKVIDGLPANLDRPDLRFLSGDFDGLWYIPGPFTHIVHLAPTKPADATRLLEFACRKWHGKTLLVSSGSIYGKQINPHTAEYEDRLSEWPLDQRGADKWATEENGCRFCREYGVPVKIARPFAFVGPYLQLDRGFAASDFLRDALAGGPVRVKDGSAVRSYLYMSDLMVWLWTILFKGEPCRPYNVGSEEAITVSTLARCIADQVGCAMEDSSGVNPDLTPDRYVPSTKRAREELGLVQRVPLGEALAKTIRWYKEKA